MFCYMCFIYLKYIISEESLILTIVNYCSCKTTKNLSKILEQKYMISLIFFNMIKRYLLKLQSLKSFNAVMTRHISINGPFALS